MQTVIALGLRQWFGFVDQVSVVNAGYFEVDFLGGVAAAIIVVRGLRIMRPGVIMMWCGKAFNVGCSAFPRQ